jgi:hypothetical protein
MSKVKGLHSLLRSTLHLLRCIVLSNIASPPLLVSGIIGKRARAAWIWTVLKCMSTCEM